VVCDPHPALRTHVERYQGYSEQLPEPARRRHVPTGLVPLIVGLGAPLRFVDKETGERTGELGQVFVAGMHDSYTDAESADASSGVQVDFTPIGAHLFLGRPLSELTNRIVELEHVLGGEGREFAERMRAAPDPETRFAIADAAIAARLAGARPPSCAVVWAWRKLVDSAGRASIGTLASEIGWSRKHLTAKFREQIGLPPKTLARVLRFRRAVRMIEDGLSTRWVDVALAAGYFDQAHMIRDFIQFAGTTPRDFVARRLPDRGGMVGD
jgi:AraC-like DNA-binding protein